MFLKYPTLAPLMPSLHQAGLLLVDDDPTTLQYHSRLLAGYPRQRFATSAEAAFATLEEWQPDLMLLDLQMPGMGGLEVLQRMRTWPASRQAPVIVVTQQESPEIEASVFEHGAVDFVVKPAAGPALRARVAMHLRLRQLQHAAAPLALGPDLDSGFAEPFVAALEPIREAASAEHRSLTLLLVELRALSRLREAQGSFAASALMNACALQMRAAAWQWECHLGWVWGDTMGMLITGADANEVGGLASRIRELMALLWPTEGGGPIPGDALLRMGAAFLPPSYWRQPAPQASGAQLLAAARQALERAQHPESAAWVLHTMEPEG